MPTSRRGHYALLVCLIAAAGVASQAYGQVPTTGSVNNGEFQFDWNYDMSLGEATVAFTNLGASQTSVLELYIAELEGFELDPDVFSMNPGSGSGNFSISGSSLGIGDTLLMDYTFDHTNVVLDYDQLDYSGLFDSGTLENIVTTQEIPEPATISSLLGLSVIALAKRRKK